MVKSYSYGKKLVKSWNFDSLPPIGGWEGGTKNQYFKIVIESSEFERWCSDISEDKSKCQNCHRIKRDTPLESWSSKLVKSYSYGKKLVKSCSFGKKL